MPPACFFSVAPDDLESVVLSRLRETVFHMTWSGTSMASSDRRIRTSRKNRDSNKLAKTFRSNPTCTARTGFSSARRGSTYPPDTSSTPLASFGREAAGAFPGISTLMAHRMAHSSAYVPVMAHSMATYVPSRIHVPHMAHSKSDAWPVPCDWSMSSNTQDVPPNGA